MNLDENEIKKFRNYCLKNNINNIIDEIFETKNIKYLFYIDEESINQYFLSLCKQEETNINLYKIKKILELCNFIDKFTGLKFILIHQSIYFLDLFLRKANIHDNYIENNYFQIFYEYDYDQDIETKFLILKKYNLVNFEYEFISICKSNPDKRIDISFLINKISKEVIHKGFKICYEFQNFNLIKEIYPKICDYYESLGICTNVEILQIIDFEQFYNFEEQLNFIISDNNYYMFEVLVKKISSLITIDYSIFSNFIKKMPNSLLALTLKKINFIVNDELIDNRVLILKDSWEFIN